MEFWRGTGPNSLLRRIEWDGWRFPGAGDTVTYLVFDPSERLREASRTGRPGKFPGIPCEVLWVSRLESEAQKRDRRLINAGPRFTRSAAVQLDRRFLQARLP